MNARCKNCGETLRRMMAWALLKDCGVRSYSNPALYCPDGKEHEITFELEKEAVKP